jgi:hypothetical protein
METLRHKIIEAKFSSADAAELHVDQPVDVDLAK